MAHSDPILQNYQQLSQTLSLSHPYKHNKPTHPRKKENSHTWTSLTLATGTSKQTP